METTLLFTGLLGIWFFVLSLRTIFGRRDNRVSLGTGESDDLLRRVRMHGNFAEYIPFLLIIMFLLELQGVNQWLLFTYGGLIVMGRGLHAYGLWSAKTPMWARIWGMQLTNTLAAYGWLRGIAPYVFLLKNRRSPRGPAVF